MNKGRTQAIQQMLDTQAEWKTLVDNVAQANKRIAAKPIEVFDDDGLYMETRYDSDAEDHKKEQKELRSQRNFYPANWQDIQTIDYEEIDNESS